FQEEMVPRDHACVRRARGAGAGWAVRAARDQVPRHRDAVRGPDVCDARGDADRLPDGPDQGDREIQARRGRRDRRDRPVLRGQLDPLVVPRRDAVPPGEQHGEHRGERRHRGRRALNLILDFDFIETGVAAGAPKYMEWYGAFGLMVTLIWLYLEI